MSLYQIREEAQEIIEKMLASVDMETGEILDEEKYLQSQGALKEVENRANESMEWILEYRQNLESNIIAIDSEIERLMLRKKSISRKVEGLTGYIEYFFRSMYNGKTMNFGMFSIGYRKSSAVKITNQDIIPAEYMRQPATPPPAPDKIAIKQLLQIGEVVPGAELEERDSLFIK